MLAKMGLNDELLLLKVKEAWLDAVGESIARRSGPTELAKGTLYVVVESPTWLNELRYVEKDIVTRVNDRYRELTPGTTDSPVKRLSLRAGTVPTLPKRKVKKSEPLPEPTADEERDVDDRLKDVTDPELREAARRMLLAERAVHR